MKSDRRIGLSKEARLLSNEEHEIEARALRVAKQKSQNRWHTVQAIISDSLLAEFCEERLTKFFYLRWVTLSLDFT